MDIISASPADTAMIDMGLIGAALIVVCLVAIAVIGVAVAHRRSPSVVLPDDAGEHGGVALPDNVPRVEAAAIRPLSPARRHAFIDEWLMVEAQFVHDPAGAVSRADALLRDVLQACGYPGPLVDQDQPVYRDGVATAGHLSLAISDYRIARAIVGDLMDGGPRTGELRRAMVHYRALFDDLVNEPVDFSPVIEHRDGRIHDLRTEQTRRG